MQIEPTLYLYKALNYQIRATIGEQILAILAGYRLTLWWEKFFFIYQTEVIGSFRAAKVWAGVFRKGNSDTWSFSNQDLQ